MRLRIWGLLYHHHLASGVVANLNHIGAADRCFETQLGELVLFGGKRAPIDIKQRHPIAVGAFDNYLTLVGVHLSVYNLHAVDAILGYIDGVVDILRQVNGVVEPKSVCLR